MADIYSTGFPIHVTLTSYILILKISLFAIDTMF